MNTVTSAVMDAIGKLSMTECIGAATSDHVIMDVVRFHCLRGERIPIALAGHGSGVHIKRGNPATWHYLTDCTPECPQ